MDDFLSKWLPTIITTLIGGYVALKETVLKDKKATTEYWQSVAADLRKDIDKIRADAIADRKRIKCGANEPHGLLIISVSA